MADPLSAVGVGLGVVSLLLQVIEECSKLYRHFTEASEMSQSYKYLRVRMQMEQQRFLYFAAEVTELFETGQICGALGVNQKLLVDVLFDIKSTFNRFEKCAAKYGNAVLQDNCEELNQSQRDLGELLRLSASNSTLINGPEITSNRSTRTFGRQISNAVHKLRTVARDPRRLIWVSVGKEEMETLITKLSELNSFLISLLTGSQAKRLVHAVRTNYMEILHMRSTIEELGDLVQALDYDTRNGRADNDYGLPDFFTREKKADAAKRIYLQRLAKIKIRRIEVEQLYEKPHPNTENDFGNMLLDMSALRLLHKPEEVDHRSRRTFASWNARKIWIEWINYDVVEYTPTDESRQENKAYLLARLLRNNIPAGFRTLHCLGYIKETQNRCRAKCGMVFELPHNSSSKTTFTTLRQLLTIWPKPPLSKRLRLCSTLAQCLSSFHAVDWLHKGLQSDNIIFFGTERDDEGDLAHFDLAMPYVTGFDLSRPRDRAELTEELVFDPLSDIYRHPHAQFGEARTSYRRSYDIYSFGVVLVEISLWNPIETVIGVKDITTMSHFQLSNVQAQLLGQPIDDSSNKIHLGLKEKVAGHTETGHLAQTAHECGDAYSEIVELCLEAKNVERPAYKGETHTSINFRVQMMFEEQVKNKLHYISLALTS
ncbi:prion-inhibition and propagation-domain-containing protein [Xylariaceae sp. AK1471]|nr:prion-inhibition and propagation-domain-containing protein [Xylariaceae sp. AK1471]